MNEQREGKDNQAFLGIALPFIVFMVIPAIYAAHSGSINKPLLFLSKLQLIPFTLTSDEAQEAWQRIAMADPASLSWATVQKVLGYTGSWIRWLFLPILTFFGVICVSFGRVSRLNRNFSMSSLLDNNVKSYPCLTPVVGRGKYLLSRESFDDGPWRIARTPLQFAVEHGLLVNAEKEIFAADKVLVNGLPDTTVEAYGNAWLDEGRALTVLQYQLGDKFTGFENLSPCRKALAAAFLAYADGDKKGCVAILDEVSLSYREEKNQPSCAILTDEKLVKKLEESWKKHERLLSEKSISIHNIYILPWFMALLNRARKKGVLAGSQFLWLRPLDRPLWYALNQCGGRAAWAEGFAAWAHFRAEEQAGRSLEVPHIVSGVACLRDALDAQGWLADDYLKTLNSKTSKAEQQPPAQTAVQETAEMKMPSDADRICYPAEQDYSDYDAGNDGNLANEIGE